MQHNLVSEKFPRLLKTQEQMITIKQSRNPTLHLSKPSMKKKQTNSKMEQRHVAKGCHHSGQLSRNGSGTYSPFKLLLEVFTWNPIQLGKTTNRYSYITHKVLLVDFLFVILHVRCSCCLNIAYRITFSLKIMMTLDGTSHTRRFRK